MSLITRIQGVFCNNTPQAKSDRKKVLGFTFVLIGSIALYKCYRSISSSSLKGRISPLPITELDDHLMTTLAKELQEIPNLKSFLLQIQESIQKGETTFNKFNNGVHLFILELPGGQKINLNISSTDTDFLKLIVGSLQITQYDQYAYPLYEKLQHAIAYIGQKNGHKIGNLIMTGAPASSPIANTSLVFPPAELDKLLTQIKSRSTTPTAYLFEPPSSGEKSLRITTYFPGSKEDYKDAMRICFIEDQYHHPLAQSVADKIAEIVHQQGLPKPLIVHISNMNLLHKLLLWPRAF